MVIAFKYKVRILPRLDKHTHLHTQYLYTEQYQYQNENVRKFFANHTKEKRGFIFKKTK